MKGYDGDIYVILDISNPAKPVEAGRWWVPGQHVAGGETPQKDPNVNLHSPNVVDGNLAYLAYGDAGMIILDISDVSKPRLVSKLKFEPRHRFDAHTVLLEPGRKLAYVNSEAVVYNCKGPLDHATIVDIADPAKPVALSRYPVPVPAAGLPYTSFCDKGGRFGTHNQNQLQYNPNVQKQGNLSYATWFNAGLRVYDVTDKRLPREIGYFMAGPPEKQYLKAYGPDRKNGRRARGYARLYLRDGWRPARPVHSPLHRPEQELVSTAASTLTAWTWLQRNLLVRIVGICQNPNAASRMTLLSGGIHMQRNQELKYRWCGLFATAAALGSLVGCAWAAEDAVIDPASRKVEAKNMRLVGYNDLQARSAYQPVIHHQGKRWIAYIGHHGGTQEIPKPHNPLTKQDENNGTSVVDVTDPKNPKYLAHIPGEAGLGRTGRRADGARMRRQATAQGRPSRRSTCCARAARRRRRSGT